MLNCGYCDYFKGANKVSSDSVGENGCFCKFTGYVFKVDETENEMEYPCKDISYQDYLNRSKVFKLPYVKRGDNWKVLYKNRHPVPERKRSLIAV
jgi:hypothetical protein